MDHDIFADRAGWGNYPRLTCLVCNETVLKKPYMTAEQWERVASDFMKKHEAARPAGEAVCRWCSRPEAEHKSTDRHKFQAEPRR